VEEQTDILFNLKPKKMNCVQCNKPFTCGCQKQSVGNGVIVHKTCVNTYNNSKVNTTQPKPSNLSLELARQQIQDLRKK
jgi:hypothetical protein